MADLLVDTISEVQNGLGITSPVVERNDVKAIRKWDYFPHFDSADLEVSVYAGYHALQGQRSTYFCSALNGTELVEFAIRPGQDLVEKLSLDEGRDSLRTCCRVRGTCSWDKVRRDDPNNPHPTEKHENRTE